MIPYFSRLQIVIAAGFLVVLISIPLGFTLLKNTQMFSSSAQEAKKPTITPTKPVTKAKEVPQSSPLSDLQKLLNPTPSLVPAATPTPEVNLSFGPTLNLKIGIEGRPAQNQAAKVFIGISQGTAATKPKYLLTFTVDFPTSGVFSGLSLAGLNPGSIYTAFVKGPGQIDVASTFTMSPTESSLNNKQPLILPSGDLNEDNTINSQDFAIAKSVYGLTPSSSGWNERADFNGDKIINNLDLGFVLKNFGKSGASGIWYSPPPQSSPSASLNTTLPQGSYETSTTVKPGGGYWLWVPPAGGR